MNLELWQQAAETQNRIISETAQPIQTDNAEIWNGYLHSWDNEAWLSVLQPAYLLIETHPQVAKPFHRDAVETAILTILNNQHQHHRILDTKPCKKTAWKAFMSLRELWNACKQ